ncbi:speckle-type POZ protein [Microplitis demolitor]|uniref:speckle-type POZ protein n=1 Tax=Microplitis demolitor TaxID=69319 RepID=UPI00235B661B|nr:speckle-type POZ protein [Microplitis demolitor]XP_008545846.2 speckle-type POZ protein [Microplitis demolitor]
MMKIERGYTNIKKHVVLYEWKINEISSYIEKSDDHSDQNISIKSPSFSAGSDSEKKWSLEFKSSPAELSEGTEKKWLSVFLMHTTDSDAEVKTKYLCFILNNNNERVKIKKFSKTFKGKGGWGNRRFLDKNELLERKDELTPNNTLTVCIELNVFDDLTTMSNDLSILRKSKFRMADDFKKIFDSKIGNDVILKVKDQVFEAHKIVLMARSPVFLTMFSSEMIENKEYKVNIPDIDPDIFKYLLEFIYTDDVSNLDAVAEDLLEVADRYMLDSLKDRCAESLCHSLTVDNAVKLLILADRYCVEEMLEHVSNFILTNAENVVETPEYELMEKTNPSLGLVLFKKFAASKSNRAF